LHHLAGDRRLEAVLLKAALLMALLPRKMAFCYRRSEKYLGQNRKA